MNPVDPNTRTTLVLDKHYQHHGKFFTARAAMRHLINGRGKGLDASGNAATWDGADNENLSSEGTTYCWKDLTVQLHPDQPCLRSAPNTSTGEETRWAVPTVVVCSHHFGYAVRRGENVTTKRLYQIYKGICQYCLQKIPFSLATKDHVHPRSLGGSNDAENLVLACLPCNSAKGSQYPYLNAEGQPVEKGRSLYKWVNNLPDGVAMREEWKSYLYLK